MSVTDKFKLKKKPTEFKRVDTAKFKYSHVGKKLER